MEPGIYEGLPDAEYRKIKAISNSGLSRFRQSPAHFRFHEDNPEESDSASMAFGRAFHCSVLEPDVFSSSFVVGPEVNKNTKEWKAFVAENAEKTILSKSESDSIKTMTESILSHEDAARILKLAKHREISMVWIDEATGVLCKARMDVVCPGVQIIADLKTTKDASQEEFKRSIYNFGYYRQASFYLQGARACGLDMTDFVIVAVESSAPHCSAVYRVQEDALQVGQAENLRLLQRYQECLNSGVWPGYEKGIVNITIPEWALKKSDRSNIQTLEF